MAVQWCVSACNTTTYYIQVNLIYKNTLYSCRDSKKPNPATEIFCFLNQQHMILLSLEYRYPDFLTTHPPAQLFCSHTMGFFWWFSHKMQELFTQDFYIHNLCPDIRLWVKKQSIKENLFVFTKWVFLLYKHNWCTFTSWTALHNEIQHYWIH